MGSSSPSLSSVMGQAVTATILLSDWEKYGLSERVSYHFDLTEALADATTEAARSHSNKIDQHEEGENNSIASSSCGVVSLLECVPTTPWYRLTRRQKRALKNEIRSFNLEAEAHQKRTTRCHEPPKLPLRLSPASRVFFSYEMTRIAFCLDASPTLTSTYGFTGGTDGSCCPMDRLAGMVRTFFTSLVEPVQAPSTTDKSVWKPILAVTVLAVYPRGRSGGYSQNSLLVRDFRVTDKESAELLAERIEEWALSEVETEIAHRLAHGDTEGKTGGRKNDVFASYDAWTMPMYSSSLRDLIDSGDAALSILSSAARPIIVVATDGRSIACDGIIDIVSDTDRVDVPIVVLDLSSPESHTKFMLPQQGRPHNGFHLMNYDPGGAMFPLHLSDDTEALYGICRATDGCFFDSKLLSEAAKTKAGVNGSDSLAADHFFSFNRHTICPNAIQWYTLFSLSPLSPTFHSAWGKLPPTDYIRLKLQSGTRGDSVPKDKGGNEQRRPTSSLATSSSQGLRLSSGIPDNRRAQQVRRTFSTYIVNPIRIKGLLLMRVKEGYRTKQYGQSTNEPDKVFLQFMLPLELGTVLHYELSYKALPGQIQLVGFAHIKIELSGEASFIQTVKNDFLRPGGHSVRPATMAQQVSAKLCNVLRWIRKEDMLQSYLSPVKWSDQLSSADTPFIRRLGTLTALQRRRHFRFDQFDCVLIGKMPYAQDDDFLSEFREVDDGEQELIEAIDEWATKSIESRRRYVHRTSHGGGLASYCVVELSRSPVASRLFRITVENLGGSGASDRLALLSKLKGIFSELRDVVVLPKQMGQFLTGVRMHHPEQTLVWKQQLLESQHHHATWDLVKDPELLPLLMKRRTEIGGFLLLESSKDYALFARIGSESGVKIDSKDPGDLVQYELAILDDRVVVDLHIECTCGEFFPFREVDMSSKQAYSKFHRMVKNLKKRDQECGRALRSRTTLLRVFDRIHPAKVLEGETQVSCVQRLLHYASQVSMRLRFFHSSSGSASYVLQSLTEDMLLSQAFGTKVAKLSIDAGINVSNLGPGDWFLIEYNKHTIAFAHLAWSENREVSGTEGNGMVFRELTFFTVGISDLYNRRDDVADDDSENDHISERLCVSEFIDLIGAAHKDNYSSAAYIALKSDTKPIFKSFHPSDFEEVMSRLEFVEVARLLLAGENTTDNDETSKLWQIISTITHPIAGERSCLFYRGSEPSELVFQLLDDDSDALSAFDGTSRSDSLSIEEEEKENQSRVLEESSATGENDSLGVQSIPETPRKIQSTPIFVRFTLNDEPASVDDLRNSIAKTTKLAVFVSIFADTGRSNKDPLDLSHLPTSHLNVAMELTALLNAYVSEQTLERLRHCGSAIQKADIRLAKACLRKARDVVTSTIEIFFYVAKRDSMVPASAPAGCDADVEEGFKLVLDELEKNDIISFKFYGDGGAIVVDTVTGVDLLKYWCFVKVLKRRGVISVTVHHPENSSKIMCTVHEVISMCCHRVNQILLLQRLHRSRAASSLLVPIELDPPNDDLQAKQESGPFYSGLFRCPIVFRTSFDLFHIRCASNPTQVARTLEATVLHIFAVSNRRHVFVYKDEAGSIFYMNLEPEGGGVEADGKIHLLVHGIDKPGPSVTTQLTGLLKKRLLLIAVDTLGSVITKNPRYSWKRADLRFVESFEKEWLKLNSPNLSELTRTKRMYVFPKQAFDLGMVLLYFRQNLCGSSYIHPLTSEESYHENECGNLGEDDKLIESMDLRFYYSNIPSKLLHNYQGQSTLTEKGAEYARLAGSGIAIIEVALLTGDEEDIENVVDIGDANRLLSLKKKPFDTTLESLRLREIKTESQESEPVKLLVKITDTCLKRNILHEWIKLTLNQGLVAWTIERHLERMQQLPRLPFTTSSVQSGHEKNEEIIDQIHPGLPSLRIMLESSWSLPHPAILKVEHSSMICSSAALPGLALELLEKITDQIRIETKGRPSLNLSRDLSVIRLSRWGRPRRVSLNWGEHRDSNRRKVLVRDASEGADRVEVIRDTPIDCPEYIFFYRFPEYIDKSDTVEYSPPRLFKEVAIDDGTVETNRFLKHVKSLKEQRLRCFCRSFAFILSVKRNRRTLLTYNWEQQLLKIITPQLLETDSNCLVSTGHAIDSLQRHSLRDLSPLSDIFNKERQPPQAVANPKLHQESKGNEKSPPKSNGALTTKEQDTTNNNVRRGPSRRITRPLAIRRPKLIGKSVEGGAMRAVAASRARASSNIFKGGATGGGVPPRKGLPYEKRAPARKNSSKLQGNDSLPQSLVRDRQESDTQFDKELEQARRNFDSAIKAGNKVALRRHTVHSNTIQSMTKILLPLKSNQSTSYSVANFLLSHASLAWRDLSQPFLLPEKLLSLFPSSFGQTLAAWTPGLRLLPLNGPGTVSSRDSSVLLVSEARNVFLCKCLCVVKLSLMPLIDGDQIKFVVGCDGWVLTLPRRRGCKNHGDCRNSLLLAEKDSAGMDKLTAELHAALPLESMLFDYIASIIERTVRNAKGDLESKEALSLVRQLTARYKLKQQMETLRSNYKAFEATIVLKSYNNRLIDMWEGPMLFKWLTSNIKKRNLVLCGSEGLCFKKQIIVRGTHSVCFLVCGGNSPGKMKLVILCRTQGNDIYEFMFRDGSNLAIALVDQIATNAAGFAYEELSAAATDLRRSFLWNKISSTHHKEPSKAEFNELMQLCTVKPITHNALKDQIGAHRFAMMLDEELVSWKRCCELMANDDAFSPSWPLPSDSVHNECNLFYLSSEDAFLLVRIRKDSGKVEVDLVDRDEMEERSRRVVQKFINFVLYFIWSDMARMT